MRWPLQQLWQQRTGRWQHVAVDMRHAIAEFRSERATCAWTAVRRRNCGTRSPASTAAAMAAGVRLHTNFPHHRDGVLRLLGLRARQGRRAGGARQAGGGGVQGAASVPAWWRPPCAVSTNGTRHPQDDALRGLARR
ncbi:hypothetical protein ACTMU2_39850 [Cupriavidus basilensis]